MTSPTHSPHAAPTCAPFAQIISPSFHRRPILLAALTRANVCRNCSSIALRKKAQELSFSSPPSPLPFASQLEDERPSEKATNAKRPGHLLLKPKILLLEYTAPPYLARVAIGCIAQLACWTEDRLRDPSPDRQLQRIIAWASPRQTGIYCVLTTVPCRGFQNVH
jgi:hypothetical protein